MTEEDHAILDPELAQALLQRRPHDAFACAEESDPRGALGEERRRLDERRVPLHGPQVSHDGDVEIAGSHSDGSGGFLLR